MTANLGIEFQAFFGSFIYSFIIPFSSEVECLSCSWGWSKSKWLCNDQGFCALTFLQLHSYFFFYVENCWIQIKTWRYRYIYSLLYWLRLQLGKWSNPIKIVYSLLLVISFTMIIIRKTAGIFHLPSVCH